MALRLRLAHLRLNAIAEMARREGLHVYAMRLEDFIIRRGCEVAGFLEIRIPSTTRLALKTAMPNAVKPGARVSGGTINGGGSGV